MLSSVLILGYLWGFCLALFLVWFTGIYDRPPLVKTKIVQVPEEMTPDKARLVLGVRPNATEAEIRHARYRQIVNVHPDRGGSPYLAQMVNSAYSTLTRRP